MEECYRTAISYNTIRKGDGAVILFTRNGSSFMIYDTEKNNCVVRTVESPILNIEFVDDMFVVFFQRSHAEYDVETLKKRHTVIKNDILVKFNMGHKTTFLIREKELLVAREGRALTSKSIRWAALLDKDHLAVCRKNKVSIYAFRRKVFTGKLDGGYINIKDNKVYVLLNARITGHDLNLYLDVLNDFHPDKFTNIENEIVLFDSSLKEARLYQKNLSNLLFACRADDYIYSPGSKMLFTIFGDEFIVYKRSNLYFRKFELVDESIVYAEQEDEFDVSDSSHVDFTTNKPSKS